MYFLNIINESAEAGKKINDNDIHTLYAFICEVVSTIAAIYSGFKTLTKFMNPDPEKENPATGRDILFIFIYAILTVICPLLVMVVFWNSTHSIWWYLLQGFSLSIIGGFIGFVFFMRKINNILNEK